MYRYYIIHEESFKIYIYRKVYTEFNVDPRHYVWRHADVMTYLRQYSASAPRPVTARDESRPHRPADRPSAGPRASCPGVTLRRTPLSLRRGRGVAAAFVSAEQRWQAPERWVGPETSLAFKIKYDWKPAGLAFKIREGGGGASDFFSSRCARTRRHPSSAARETEIGVVLTRH